MNLSLEDSREKRRISHAAWRASNVEHRRRYMAQWTLDNKDYHKDWSAKNRPSKRASNKKWYSSNKQKVVAYALAHRAEKNLASTEWKSRNRPYSNEYNKRAYLDPANGIAVRLRTRLNSAVGSGHKSRLHAKTEDLLGCSYEHLVTWLESRFLSGMTWDNRSTWHIDHKKPLSSFDLTDDRQLRKACNYRNLQPLWAKDNLSKGGKIAKRNGHR